MTLGERELLELDRLAAALSRLDVAHGIDRPAWQRADALTWAIRSGTRLASMVSERTTTSQRD